MKVQLEAAPRRGLRGYAVDVANLLKDAGVRWFDDNCLRLGASLAYYAVFSIFPLLLLAVTGVGFFLGHDPETRAHVLDLEHLTKLGPPADGWIGGQSHGKAARPGRAVGTNRTAASSRKPEAARGSATEA
jgi:hypothetical protein